MNGRVLVVDDHTLVSLALELALSAQAWHVETSDGPTVSDVIDHARRFEPGCVLLDINLGALLGSGIDLIAPLASTGARVMMMTAERRRMVLAECVDAGAVGWVTKGASLDEMHAALCAVVGGGSVLGRGERAALLDELRRERARSVRSNASFETLTRREAVVLGALVDGLSAEEIAHTQFVSVATVRTQIRAILQKLGVRSQLAAVAIAGPHRHLLPHEDADRERRRAHPRGRSVAVLRAG